MAANISIETSRLDIALVRLVKIRTIYFGYGDGDGYGGGYGYGDGKSNENPEQ